MKLKYIGLLISFLLFAPSKYLLANVDSLKFNQNIIDNFSCISKNTDSIIIVSKANIELLKKHNTYLIGQNLRIVGICYYIKNDFETALPYLEKAFDLLKDNYKSTAAKALSLVGSIQSRKALNNEAEKTFNEALQLAFESKDLDIINYLRKEIARHLFLTEKFNDAIIMAENCLPYYQEQANTEEIVFDVLNIIAICKLETDSFNAKPYLDNAYFAAEKLGSIHAISIANANLASFYSKIEDYNKALDLNLRSLEQLILDNYTTNIVPLYINIGYNYLCLKNYKLAEEYLKKGIELAEVNNLTSFLKKGYKHLYATLKAIKNTPEALDAKIKFLKYSLTLKNEENLEKESRLTFLNTIELEKAKNENLELKISQKEKEIKQQQIYLISLLIFIIVVFILAFALIKNYKNLKVKQKELFDTNEQIKELSHRKDQLISIVSHDLKEPLCQLIYMQEEVLKNDIEKDQYIKFMHKIYNNSLNAMELLNNFIVWGKLYLSNHIEFAVIDLNKFLTTVASELEFQSSKKNIEVKIEASNFTFNSEENILKSILRNVVGNAIKFSAPNTIVSIEAIVLENTLNIYVRDTGKGFDALTKAQFEDENESVLNSNVGTAKEKGNGIGLALSRDFAKKIGARLFIQKSDGLGTVMALSLPLN